MQHARAVPVAMRADDRIDPPELAIIDKDITRVPRDLFALRSITSETRGHATHLLSVLWGSYLGLLASTTR